MNQKNPIKKPSDVRFEKFLEARKSFSSFDKKVEAGSLIDQAQSVDVQKGWWVVKQRIQRRSSGVFSLNLLTRVAAVFSIPLLAFTIWSLFFQPQDPSSQLAEEAITWQQVESPVGMRSHVVLPDGTNLWLNAGSQVRYSIPFSRATREIELTGEAFLDVVKKAATPFIVNTGNASVEVLGTQFNVNAYPESGKIEVALKEGKVKFRFPGEQGIQKYCELNPSDYLLFDKEEKTLYRDNRNIEKYIAWHQNILILDDTPMTEVARLLELWYGVDVVLKDEALKKYKFTTTFENEPLFRVLELLEISTPGISIKYSPGKPLEGTKRYSRSIVTITQNDLPMKQ